MRMLEACDLRRSYETGNCLGLLLNFPVIRCADLREIDVGEWTDRCLGGLSNEFPTEFHLWKQNIGKAVRMGDKSVARMVFEQERL